MDTCNLRSIQPRVLPRAPSTRSSAFALLLWGVALVASCAAMAAPVAPTMALTVPNGDFSVAANNGSIGGGVIGGSGNAAIGTGPWSGTYNGALGLLAPPTLTIGSGKATIGGLLGINIAGIVNNNGRIHQNTGIALVANRRYTLTAEVDAGTTLNLGVLTSGNAGIALATGTSTGSRIASSATVGLASLSLISGSTYRVSVSYDTGSSVSGNVNVQLFSEPVGLLDANLLGSISFDNVKLSTHLLTQVPAALQPGNAGPYVAVVNQAVAPAISVVVLDTLGDPIPGVSVSFAAPASGASASFSPNPAITDANGVAHVVTTANTIAGTYDVTATVSGVSPPLVFSLTNTAGPAASVGSLSGSGQGAVTGNAFTSPLGLQALDQFGNPVSGTPVSFVAPASGATAVLGATTVTTDSNGFANTTATAGGIAGGYNIDIRLPSVGSVANFGLINLLDPSITPTDPNGPGQNASIEERYSCALLVRIIDGAGTPLEGLAVQFTAPASGASAILSDGVISGSDIETTTDADGLALVEATANGIEGSYEILAQLKYSLSAPVIFQLRNLGANDPLYANGFDGPCIPAVGLLEASQAE